VLIDGTHSAAEFGAASERVIGATVAQLWRQGVQLEGCLLKPQMIIKVGLMHYGGYAAVCWLVAMTMLAHWFDGPVNCVSFHRVFLMLHAVEPMMQ
jgi:hypothetical protein